MSSIPQLSVNDSKVLSALFDPETSPSSVPTVASSNASLPHVPESDLPALQAAEREAISPLQAESPSEDSVKAAISALSELIAKHPGYASAYTNRAQTRRLLIGTDLFSSVNTEPMTEIFSDLAQGIALTSPKAPQESVSPLQAKILATAHTHRGYLLLKAAKMAESGALEGGPTELRRASTERLEEMAGQEFALGGRYGDKVARQMAVGMNPYAKMCGAIVKEALKEEMKGAA